MAENDLVTCRCCGNDYPRYYVDASGKCNDCHTPAKLPTFSAPNRGVGGGNQDRYYRNRYARILPRHR